MTEPESAPILLEHRAGPIRYITLNRPERLNAINRPMLAAIDAAFEAARQDDSCKVVVLRGSGRAFSTGFDITQGGYTPGQSADLVLERNNVQAHNDRWLRVWDFPKPVIAQVHGYCLASATQLVAVCDLTIASTDAVFGSPALSLGGGFISPMWVHLVGPKRAKEMSFVAGNQISADEAAEWGFVNRAVAPDQLADTVRRLAARISLTPGPLLQMKKVAINRAVELSGFRTTLSYTAEINALLHHSEQVLETRASIRGNGLRATIQDMRERADEIAVLDEIAVEDD
jgi:enoyl-CoA hydratase